MIHNFVHSVQNSLVLIWYTEVLVKGGGGTPCNGVNVEALFERGIFFRL